MTKGMFFLRLSFGLALFLASLSAQSESLEGKVCRLEGYVVIQRGADLINLAFPGAKPDVAVKPGDALRTRKGTAEILYDNGSSITVENNTVIVFPSRQAEEKAGDNTRNELRLRVVIGAASASIKGGCWEKVVFLGPQSRAAILEGELRFLVNESGDWQLSLKEGRALITELSLKLMWQALPGHSFRVEYVPRGLRITNMAKSTRPAAIGLYVPGEYEIVAEKGDIAIVYSTGQRSAVEEKGSARVELPPERTVVKELDPSEAVLILRSPDVEGLDRVKAAIRAWQPEEKEEEPKQAGPDD